MTPLGLLLILFPLLVASIRQEERVDCQPGEPGDSDICAARGCLWDPVGVERGVPWCYLPPEYGYRADGEAEPTAQGSRIHLTRNTVGEPLYGSGFSRVTVEVEEQTQSRLRVRIYPTGEERWRVPITIDGTGTAARDPLYDVQFTYEPVFSFKVVRKSSGAVLFDSSLGGLTLADQFLQIGARLPQNSSVYGFGEQEQHSFKLSTDWYTLSMFARDHPPEGDINIYGVHPRYTVLEEDGSTHGVLFLNSNAQEVTLTPAPGLVYRTTGGELDIYFFLGPDPEQVVSQYTEAVGRYYVPPYWALGFHLCRWGYNSLTNMEAAWQRTRDAGIPFDAQWGDIDIMDRALDFTVNPNEFSGLSEFAHNLHEIGMHFVTILDPCISTGEPRGEYPPFDLGDELNIWVMDSNGEPLVAKVWPADNCFFPDYTNPVTQQWWEERIAEFQALLPWDGLWIDMNEPANFVDGSATGCANNSLNYPPFKPHTFGGALAEKTICMDSKQHWSSHYDLHSMFGWSETEPTLRGVQTTTGKRGLVLSRSTFVGSGRWTAHWLGDNWSRWDNMHYSIIGMLQFNQFGIPLVGADICGFIEDSTEELCARWQQLGAFYPFSRNHNNIDAIEQDPGLWEGGLVARVARDALLTKYSLLPVLYTLFFIHSTAGETVVRPLWHEFPQDAKTRDIDTQFLWGSSLLVSPILEQGTSERSAYLPTSAVWYDFYTRQKVIGGEVTLASSLSVETDSIPLHVRGGAILPSHLPGLTTQQTRTNNMTLTVYLDSSHTASGLLYLDDGESIDSEKLGFFSLMNYTVEGGVMTGMRKTSAGYTDAEFSVTDIWVCGLVGSVSGVMVDNALHQEFVYSPDEATLHISSLAFDPIHEFTVHWV